MGWWWGKILPKEHAAESMQSHAGPCVGLVQCRNMVKMPKSLSPRLLKHALYSPKERVYECADVQTILYAACYVAF